MKTGQVEQRYLEADIPADALADGKMAFLSGPRQVGKTTLAKRLLLNGENYRTWDDSAFRVKWSRSPSASLADRAPGPIVLDELHKDRRWKARLKGVYDQDLARDGIIVTGSARLDLYRKGGDSLMGRYIPYRLHPFSVAETRVSVFPDQAFEITKPVRRVRDLLSLGGFPEPFLGSNAGKANRWSRLRLERLIAEDVRDLRAVGNLAGLTVLSDLLPERVGSLLSINSMREDVGAAYGTVQNWLQVFEALYHCFTIKPYFKRVTRAIRSAPKLYLFDILAIDARLTAKRLENLTALHLLKACHYWTDLGHGHFALHFVRDKQGREADFLVVRDKTPWLLVECKSGDVAPSASLLHFATELRVQRSFQLVERAGFDREYPVHHLRVLDYERFFSGLV